MGFRWKSGNPEFPFATQLLARNSVVTVTLAATEGEAGGRMSRIQRLKDGTTGTDAGTTPSEQRLIRHLLRHYDVDARGVPSVNATTFVTIQLFLLRMQQLVCDFFRSAAKIYTK